MACRVEWRATTGAKTRFLPAKYRPNSYPTGAMAGLLETSLKTWAAPLTSPCFTRRWGGAGEAREALS